MSNKPPEEYPFNIPSNFDDLSPLPEPKRSLTQLAIEFLAAKWQWAVGTLIGGALAGLGQLAVTRWPW